MQLARVRLADKSVHFARCDLDHLQLLDAHDLVGAVNAKVIDEIANEKYTKLLPITRPSKIVCVGRNYAKHAQELGNDVPKEPKLFMKPSSSLIGHNQAIVLPEQSELVHHEAELAIVIKSELKNANEAEAEAGILGCTIANDVTARDLQRKDTVFTRAKGFDTFCPLGPMVTTLDAVKDLQDLEVKLWVNDELRQSANTGDMVFSVTHILSYISKIMTLYPGDLVLTGTPEGVGALTSGDVVRVAIEGLGHLENPVA